MARNLEWVTPENRRLLDVGCGNGEFMEFARQAGWLVQGVDIDVAAVTIAKAKGLDVIAGGIEQFAGQTACFDRITLSHVVEHVFDPMGLLRDCFRLLKPGGVLWVDTPNMGSAGLRVFGEYWRGLEPPRHLMLFSRASLIDSLIKIGFGEIVDRFSTLATTAVWRESREIMSRASVKRNWRQALPGRFLADVDGIFAPTEREFVTLTCRKPG
ncbi:class I SAM-dependent methyltransferase [Dechloromonas denitrificans]|uniref:class I SAM-dependent methyltransferase n=1 Tax=Dechloromonas denitrificans TaxID=281362 RepID=UPI0012F8D5AD|nr:methyltransferase domain-containing protein [Dechloromonas denitrificans]